MNCDPLSIASDVESYVRVLEAVPWFRNLGKPNPHDSEVRRIHSWEEWPGPEGGYGDWFGRWPCVIRERIEASLPDRLDELKSLSDRIEEIVHKRAATNSPMYDPNEDAWHGPTACVWCAEFTATLIGWHILLARRLPVRLALEWKWYVAGHWPCDYAEEPPNYFDQSAMEDAHVKLLVY